VGTLAEWSAATFGISESRGVLVLGPIAPPSPQVTTQAVLHVSAPSHPEESFYSEQPKVENKLVAGEPRLLPVDPDMRRFFRRKDIYGSSMRHVPIIRRDQVIRVSEDEAREADFEKIQKEIGANRQIPIEFAEISEARMLKRHPFIVRAKYRLPGNH
jgi:hypothetical protein